MSNLSKHIVVGGLGNLGKHMQRTLVSRGLPTTVIDRGDGGGGRLVDSSIEFVSHKLGIDDPKNLVSVLEGADTMYSMVTPDVQNGTKKDFLTTNEKGASHLVEACREAGVGKLVYVSSIAVTNHFAHAHNQNESHPLPAMSEYESFYDISKRRGEDIVLEANDGDKLRTCSIRLGGLLGGPGDYMLRKLFASDSIPVIQGQRIDYIFAGDFCRALFKASEKLDDETSCLPGKALFVTKGRGDNAPHVHDINKLMAELLDKPTKELPPALFSAVWAATWAKDMIIYNLKNNDDLNGIPPHKFMDMHNYEQTFDNSLAREILDFEPELSWDECLHRIVEEYKKSAQPGV